METPVQRPILLVEDNPMDIDLALRAFARQGGGHPIDVVRDGAEALGRLARWDAGAPQPLVILLDLNLPGLHGLEVLRALKNHPVYRRIPVVVLTTSAEDSDVDRAYDVGANSYIVKPVDFDQFVQIAGQIGLYWGAVNTPNRRHDGRTA